MPSTRTRVLVVEDDDDVSAAIAEFLRNKNFDVETAADTAHAERLVERSENFHLAIVDYVLPGERGGCLAERLGKIGIPTILITGSMERFGQIGSAPCEILRKPFRMAKLLEIIEQTLAGADNMTALDALLRSMIAGTGAQMGNIQLRDGAGHLRIAAHHGFERDFLDFFAVVDNHLGSCGRALGTAGRVIVPDVVTSPIFRATPSLTVMLRADARSCYSTPIIVGGTVRGMISVHRKVAWSPSADELRVSDHHVAQAAALLSTIGHDTPASQS